MQARDATRSDVSAGAIRRSIVRHLFVYGTLRPGDVRWRLLADFVADDGLADTVAGQLFDTGLDYPAAVFDQRATFGSIVVGRTYSLLADSMSECLDALDVEEGTVAGVYRRIVVTTTSGVSAYAYEYGDGLDLTVIESGDWFDRIRRADR